MKKVNRSIGYAIIVIGLLALAGIIFYSYSLEKDRTQYFREGKESVATRLYDSLMAQDLTEDYPRTPEEVMDINLDIMYIIYGLMVEEHEVYENLIHIQRQLFTDELLEMNSYESQYATVMEGVEFLDEHGVYCLDIIQKPVIYDPFDNNLCFIRVDQNYSDSTKLYWEYELKRESQEDVWKIARWSRTDETYLNILE